MTPEQHILLDNANKIYCEQQARRSGDGIAFEMEKFAEALGIKVSSISVNVTISSTWEIKEKA